MYACDQCVLRVHIRCMYKYWLTDCKEEEEEGEEAEEEESIYRIMLRTPSTASVAACSSDSNDDDMPHLPSPPPMDLTTLEEIDNCRSLKLLMEDWQQQANGLRKQLQHKELQCGRSHTEAFCFFMFHIIFQAALLAVVLSHRDSLSCDSIWAPITISLLSALPFAFVILHKLSVSENLQIQLEEERSILRDLHSSIQQLRVRGKKFKLNPGEAPYPNRKRILFHLSSLGMVVGYSGSILVVFVAFTTVILVSCYRILCYSML